MERRQFLNSALAATALTTKLSGAQPAAASSAGEYYELRKYRLESGPQQKLTDTYVAESLIQALNRLGISPVGAFTVDIGPETPTLYLLLPCASLETLVTSEQALSRDEAFVKAAAPFWSAPAKEPAFVRMES